MKGKELILQVSPTYTPLRRGQIEGEIYNVSSWDYLTHFVSNPGFSLHSNVELTREFYLGLHI